MTPWLRTELHVQLPLSVLGLGLSLFYTCPSCCEFICAAILLYPEITVPLQSVICCILLLHSHSFCPFLCYGPRALEREIVIQALHSGMSILWSLILFALLYSFIDNFLVLQIHCKWHGKINRRLDSVTLDFVVSLITQNIDNYFMT